MAKAGLINEAARQELIAEMNELKAANFEADGVTRKRDFVPYDIARIREIEELLGMTGNSAAMPAAEDADYPALKKMAKQLEIPAVGNKDALRVAVIAARDEQAGEVETPEPEPQAAPEDESDAAKIKRLQRKIKGMERKQGRSREAAKMRSVDTAGGKHVPRPDEIMEEALDDAEDREPTQWDDSNRLAVEREIRKSVKKGGSRKNHQGNFYDIGAGFKKGITLKQKKYALELLEKMGRLACPAAEILELLAKRATLSPGQQKQTAKEHNAALEVLGVMWDDTIQVPGMSAALK